MAGVERSIRKNLFNRNEVNGVGTHPSPVGAIELNSGAGHLLVSLRKLHEITSVLSSKEQHTQAERNPLQRPSGLDVD